jgi:hypothetical protein
MGTLVENNRRKTLAMTAVLDQSQGRFTKYNKNVDKILYFLQIKTSFITLITIYTTVLQFIMQS